MWRVKKNRSLVKIKYKRWCERTRSKALNGCPQKWGICIKTFEMKPKKPNSSNRKVAKVRLSNGRKVHCYIPGSGHDLKEYSRVMVRGGHVPDLPGVQYHIIRGKGDLSWKEKWVRKNKRSKYGVPRDQTQMYFK